MIYRAVVLLCCVVFCFSGAIAAQPETIYLLKSVTTPHGVIADCWAITAYNSRYIKRKVNEPGGEKEKVTEVSGVLSLWVDNNSMDAVQTTLMGCVFNYTIDGKIKDLKEEIYQSIIAAPEPGQDNRLRCGQVWFGFDDAVPVYEN